MIEIEMSRDIREFEPKIIGPLTVRQLIISGIGILVAVPFLLYLPVSLMAKIIITSFIVSPIIVCAFTKLYGMNAEVFILKVLIPYLTTPTKRKYKTENTFEYIRGTDQQKTNPEGNKKRP